MKYAYWTVECKTPKCGALIAPKDGYIGICQDAQTFIDSERFPVGPATMRCFRCGKDHEYESRDFSARKSDRKLEQDSTLNG